MIRQVVIFAVILSVAGCGKGKRDSLPVATPVAPAVLSPVTAKDMCWQEHTKQAMEGVLNADFNAIFSDMLGQEKPLDEILTAPRSVSVRGFSLKRFDRDTGNFVCSAWVTMTLDTKHHGRIVVPDSSIDFDVTQAESGPTVLFDYAYFVPFMQTFRDQLKKVSINLRITGADGKRY